MGTESPESRPGGESRLPEGESYRGSTPQEKSAAISRLLERYVATAPASEAIGNRFNQIVILSLGGLGLTAEAERPNAPPVDSDTTTGERVVPLAAISDNLRGRFRMVYESVFPFRLREATKEDVPAMVDIDLVAFRSVYKNYTLTPEELRADLLAKFSGRFEKLGGQWSEMLFSHSGKALGFIMACPTAKPPEDFKSWEDTTDNGTLETTYNPKGRYLYVVSLSVLPEGSNAKGQDMLMTNMIGRIIAGDYQAYFESRLPGLKKWVLARCREERRPFAALSLRQKNDYAQEYFESLVEKDGQKVPLDPLMRLYQSMGCSFIKLAPDAYQDDLSMNFGVVCQFDNPVPDNLRRNPLVRKTIGAAIRAASHSPRLLELI